MRFTLLFISLTLLAGCSTLDKAKPMDQTVSVASHYAETPLYLESSDRRELLIEDFLEDRTSFTEQDKINYLLGAIRQSKAVFIRNGDHFDGLKASQWLRWKMRHKQYNDDPIVTAEDFVNRVAIRSERSGFPYEIISETGGRERLQRVLTHELLALEDAIREHSLMDALSKQGSQHREKKENLAPPPQILPTPAL